MEALKLYTNFFAKNPGFGLYILGVKIALGYMIYHEIKEKYRNTGRLLARV